MTDNERRLYLIPSTLGESLISQVLPAGNLEIMNGLRHFVVEEEKTARRFLINCGFKNNLDLIRFYTLNEHTNDRDIPVIFSDSGDADIGLISEAGVPAVADPGARLVEVAMKTNIRVIPLVGPSSIILAVMASGLNGQRFAFNGYLPVKNQHRNNRIIFFEKRSRAEQQSQVFIEAPYRNNQLVEAFLENCRPDTRLCIASYLTLDGEWIHTKTIREWRAHHPPDLKNKPAVFILMG